MSTLKTPTKLSTQLNCSPLILQRQRGNYFLQQLVKTNIASIIMDGSTNSGNLEEKVNFVVYCEKDDTAHQISICTHYLAVVSLKKDTSEGHVDCL